MNILLTCCNGSFTGEVIHLLKEIYYIDEIFLADSAESKYKNLKTIKLPNGKEDSYVEKLLEVCKRNNIRFIIPRSDEEIVSISNNIKKFEALNINTFCQSSDIVSLASDKGDFLSNLKSNGISVDFFIPNEWGDIKDYKDRFAYKKSNSIIVKPKRSSGSKGVWLIDFGIEGKFMNEIVKDRTFNSSYDSFYEFTENEEIDPSHYLVQPYYGSNIYDVDNLYARNQKKLFQVCRKRVYKNEFSPVNEGCVIKKNRIIFELVENIFDTLNIDGFLDLDIAMDPNGEPHVIDSSTRLSGSISASSKCGINFIKLILDYYVLGLIPEVFHINEAAVIPYEGFRKVH